MALDEVSFYNVNGDEVNLTNLVAQMINYYEQKLEVGENKITDFNEGSNIRNLLEAFAVLGFAIMEEQYESTRIAFINTSYGDWLDRIGESPFINLERESGVAANGTVTFTLSAALSDDYVIPAETLLSSSDEELDFITLTDGEILAGETSVTVSAECLTEGVDGNVAAGSIDTISDESIDTEIVSVTNEYPFEFGMDYEEDDDYRERLLNNIQAEGFGTMGYYKSLAEAVDGVHDVKLISDDNYTRNVLVNGDVKPTPAPVLLDVLTVFSDLNNIVLGHNFIVDRPDYVTVNMTFNLDVTTLIDEDSLLAKLNAFINGGSVPSVDYTGLMIGEDVTADNLNAVMSSFEYVVNSSVTIQNHTIDNDNVLKLGTVTFNQTVVD